MKKKNPKTNYKNYKSIPIYKLNFQPLIKSLNNQIYKKPLISLNNIIIINTKKNLFSHNITF